MAASLQGRVVYTTPDCRGRTHSNTPIALMLAASVLCLFSSLYYVGVLAPKSLGQNAPSANRGLYPEWVGSREILLHRRSPYRQEVTDQIQVGLNGHTTPSGPVNQQRFAYPAYFAFLFAPIALLPFPAARALAFAACLVSVVVCVSAWSRCFALSHRVRWLVLLIVLSTFPCALGLRLCQPTLVVGFWLAVSVYFAHSGRLAWSGILAGLSTAKPHIAIGVLVPMTVWALCEWHARKRFCLWFVGSTTALVVASELILPGWIADWLAATSAYSHYAGASPILFSLLHGHGESVAVILLLGVTAYVSYRYREADPLFAIAFTVGACQLVLPFLIYNEVALVPAALWLMKNDTRIRKSGQVVALLSACSWIVLGAGLVSTVGLAISNILAPGAGMKLWQLPLIAAWCYPPAIFAALVAVALRRTSPLP